MWGSEPSNRCTKGAILTGLVMVSLSPLLNLSSFIVSAPVTATAVVHNNIHSSYIDEGSASNVLLIQHEENNEDNSSSTDEQTDSAEEAASGGGSYTEQNTTRIVMEQHADKYHILHNVCLQAKNNDSFFVKMKRTNQTKEDYTIRYQVFRGSPRPTNLRFRVVFSDAATNTVYQSGTTMLTSHHTPDNNFHLHNNFLLPVFRAYSFLNLTRLLLLRGCTKCWQKRAPIMQHILNMMNLTDVVYPIQDVLLNSAGDRQHCYEWLVIEKQGKGLSFPYYNHAGRFSPRWPQRLFFSYRDHVHAYEKSLNKIAVEETNDVNKSRKPVLTWVSRGSPNPRQIMNEPEVIEELSKYFRTHVIDFSPRRNTTVLQSMEYTAETNVLIGLHGAGLAYAALLPNSSMLVELRGNYGKHKKMFMNIANKLDLPYYAAQLEETNTNTVQSIPSFARQVYDAWSYHYYDQEEAKHHEDGFTGECLFPRELTPHGGLSNTSVSRCYLEQHPETNVWSQCVAFGECE